MEPSDDVGILKLKRFFCYIDMNDNKVYLNQLRHSSAHLLAAAVLAIWPEAKPTIGPSIDDGFYYDFDFGEVKVSSDDLPKIEKKMQELVKSWSKFERIEVSVDEAKKRFEGNSYKLELIEQFSSEGEPLSFYKSGEFVDLCRGGHIENPSKDLKYFKLLSVAGAYWRGDEKNKMLTRIYGTAFPSQKELDEYLERQEEAKKRDHKKLGQELDLFFMDDEIGKGLPIWTPKGTVIKQELEKFTIELERKYGYLHVETPYLGKDKLYETSGHLEHYRENMYAPIDMDGDVFYLRPMACPHHIKIYQHKLRSYKDLPIRYAEIADYNRYEKSGELMGLIRVRKFQLTDGHLFVRPDQLKDEFIAICKMIQEATKALGISEKIRYRFSKHDPNDSHKYYPDPELWKKSEGVMKEALDELGLEYTEAVGEAAFYGPKLDVQMVNVNGKEDTAFTGQIDFLLPEKFNLHYIDENNEKKRPVMLHRSTIGCIERTTAFLIEHFAGAFPTWLAPVQVKVLPIADDQHDYAQKIAQKLRDDGVRVEVDDRSERLQSKIRDAQMEKIPYMLVIGKREMAENNVAVRTRNEDDLGAMDVDVFVNGLKNEIKEKSLELMKN